MRAAVLGLLLLPSLSSAFLPGRSAGRLSRLSMSQEVETRQGDPKCPLLKLAPEAVVATFAMG